MSVEHQRANGMLKLTWKREKRGDGDRFFAYCAISKLYLGFVLRRDDGRWMVVTNKSLKYGHDHRVGLRNSEPFESIAAAKAAMRTNYDKFCRDSNLIDAICRVSNA